MESASLSPSRVFGFALTLFYLCIVYTALSLHFSIYFKNFYSVAPSHKFPLNKRLFPKKLMHCPLSKKKKKKSVSFLELHLLKLKEKGNSLVVHRLRFSPPNAGARVQSLIRELDPTFHD